MADGVLLLAEKVSSMNPVVDFVSDRVSLNESLVVAISLDENALGVMSLNETWRGAASFNDRVGMGNVPIRWLP